MSTATLPATRVPRRWLAGGLAIGLLAAMLAAPTAALAQNSSLDLTNTISVTGTGRIFVEPDVADITIGVSAERGKARAASQAAAETMAKVIEAIKAQGVADKDIQTAQVSLQPVYDYSSEKPVLTGYRADNLVTVTVRDLAKAGDIIDAAVEAGANQVSGISFRVDDPTAATDEARVAAVNDAKARAESLAAAAGVTISGVVAISEMSSPYSPPIYYAEEMARGGADAAATPVMPGNVQLTVTVNIVYSIGS